MLQPVSIHVSFDMDDMPLRNFTPVLERVVRLKQEKKAELIAKKQRNSKSAKSKIQPITFRPVIVNGRYEPSRGFIVRTHQCQFPTNGASKTARGLLALATSQDEEDE